MNPEFEYENLAESAQETINERHQEAQTEGHRSAWLEPLAVSTALFAVLAAFASLKAGDSANEALYRANQAVLQQTQAVDTWSQFQADSIKKYQAQSLIILLPHVGGSAAEVAAAKQQVASRQKTQDTLLVGHLPWAYVFKRLPASNTLQSRPVHGVWNAPGLASLSVCLPRRTGSGGDSSHGRWPPTTR